MSTLLLLARHGQTDDNARRIFQGQRGSGLNARGRAQAEKLATRVAKRIDAIVSSDLERARETADVVARTAKLEVEVEPGLREVDVGAWTGLSFDEVESRFPEEWAAFHAGLDVPRGGGETYAALADRVTTTLVAVARRFRGQRVLVVSHGAALRSVVCKALGVPPRYTAPVAGMQNAALTTVSVDESAAIALVAYNDAAHLADLG